MAYSLFHTVKYKNHSVGYIFHTVGYKSHGVKQRMDKGILGNIGGVFYFHIMRHAVSILFGNMLRLTLSNTTAIVGDKYTTLWVTNPSV